MEDTGNALGLARLVNRSTFPLVTDLLPPWTAAAARSDRLAARAVPDGVLVTVAPMQSTFLALRSGPWEQLTATLDAGFADRAEAERLAALTSLARTHAFTLGARAAVDRRGALVVVSDRVADTLTPDLRAAWVLSVQVVANGLLSLLAATEAGGPVGHDEAQAMLTRRVS